MRPPRRALALAALPATYAAARVATVARVRRFESLDPEAAGVPGTFLYVRGRRLRVLTDGAGPPLLLIHGFLASADVFARLAPLLRGERRLIAVDLPGHGFSARDPDADHSHEANAALLLDLLDRLGVERTAVLGHSIGAAIAMRMAALAPERVTALVLAGGPGADPVLPRWTRPLLTVTAPWVAGSRLGVRALTRAAMRDGDALDAGTVKALHTAARVPGHAATLLSMITATRHGPTPPAERVRCPALVLTGERDGYLPPRKARELASRLPRAEVAVMPGAAHMTVLERPDDCARRVLPFLRTVDGESPPQPRGREAARETTAAGSDR